MEFTLEEIKTAVKYGLSIIGMILIAVSSTGCGVSTAGGFVVGSKGYLREYNTGRVATTMDFYKRAHVPARMGAK